MSLPCIGAGITVAVKKWGEEHPKLLRAYVEQVQELQSGAVAISWRCGARFGDVWSRDEGIEWAHGHGPQARAALLAQRALSRAE